MNSRLWGTAVDETRAWHVFAGLVYALCSLALLLPGALGFGGYIFYMIVWLHAPMAEVLLFSAPCVLVLLVGARASAAAAWRSFR